MQLDHPEHQREQRQLHFHRLRPGELIQLLWLRLREGTCVNLVRRWRALELLFVYVAAQLTKWIIANNSSSTICCASSTMGQMIKRL